MGGATSELTRRLLGYVPNALRVIGNIITKNLRVSSRRLVDLLTASTRLLQGS